MFQTKTIDTTYPVENGSNGLLPALDRICAECSQAVSEGYTLLVLSDRAAGPEHVPIS